MKINSEISNQIMPNYYRNKLYQSIKKSLKKINEFHI